MNNVSGRIMDEKDYRGVTRHLTDACENSPLKLIPVLITGRQATIISKYTPTTPLSTLYEENLNSNEYAFNPHGLFPTSILVMQKLINQTNQKALNQPIRILPNFVGDILGNEKEPVDSLIPTLTKLDKANVLEYFTFLGRFIAKALQDNRLLDIPVSLAFCKLMLRVELTFEDLQQVDESLYRSLKGLVSLAETKQLIEQENISDVEKRSKIEPLTLRGVKIEDMSLDFTLPGHPDIELKENGANIKVDIFNLDEYISLIVRALLIDGVVQQMAAFRSGFNEVFPVETLTTFAPIELQSLFSANVSYWDRETLVENIRCDHGYHSSSRAVKYLINILSEMKPEDQRKFILFVTGSPRLPVGGLKTLRPRLTVVRKTVDDAFLTDNSLPSVSTCFYYLKLPDYSSEIVMRKNLYYAINEGQGSFLLS